MLVLLESAAVALDAICLQTLAMLSIAKSSSAERTGGAWIWCHGLGVVGRCAVFKLLSLCYMISTDGFHVDLGSPSNHTKKNGRPIRSWPATQYMDQSLKEMNGESCNPVSTNSGADAQQLPFVVEGFLQVTNPLYVVGKRPRCKN